MRFVRHITGIMRHQKLTAFSVQHDIDAIVARHENDQVLEARGEMTEFEARALLVARAPPNGE